jgi:NAD+ synthase
VASPLSFDEDSEEKRIKSFIEETVTDAGASGVVVGLSGGVDSSVVCTLCVRSLGRKRVLGLLMPSSSTPRADMTDAQKLASSLGIQTREAPIRVVVDDILSIAGREGGRIPKANLQARARMAFLYYSANTLNRLVAGTGDRSEILIGFFTKWGDGGVDFLPIGHLYKTQVRMLARHLGLSDKIASKPASPQLWSGHKATDEIPADYESLDLAMHYIFDMRLAPHEAAFKAKLELGDVTKMIEMNKRSAHKRSLPPTIGPLHTTQIHRYGYT